MNKLFTRIATLGVGLAMAIGVGVAIGSKYNSVDEPVRVQAAEGDTHDFSQSLSQLLNNGASISDITVPAQSYTVKEVIITYQHNKNLSGNFVTASCKIGGSSFGSSAELTANSPAGTTASFSATAASGAIVISFENHRSGTKQGTLQVTNVRLVEGPAPHVDVSSVSVSPDTTTLLPGGTYNLTEHVTVLPDNATDKSVTYEVTDADPAGCATVSNAGLITAVEDGIAEITVTSVDDGTKFAVFTVGIETPSEPTISLNTNNLEGYVDGSSSLTADFVALEGTGVTWSQTSSDGGSVTLGTPNNSVSGKSIVSVTYSTAGTVVVKAKDNGGNTSAECTILISDTLNPVYGKSIETETASWVVTDKNAFGSGETEEGISDTFDDDQGNTWTYVRKLISGVAYTGSALNNGYIQLGKDGGVDNLTISTTISSRVTKVSVNCASYQNAHNVSITVGGDEYLASTSVPRWSSNSGDTVSGTGTSSGEIVISFTDGTRALYIKSISVEYDVEVVGANIANTNVVAQRAVTKFAKEFLAATDLVCEMDGSSDLSGWDTTIKSTYTSNRPASAGTNQTHFDNLIKFAESAERDESGLTPTGDVLQKALARYDWILEHHTSLSDFLHSTSDRAEVASSKSIDILGLDNKSNATLIIVVLSLVSLIAVGGYFLLKKKKEQ